MKYLLHTIIVLLILSVSCKKDYKQHQNQGEKQVKRVRVAKVEKSSEPIPVESSGILSSLSEINRSFKVGGIIGRMHVKEGERFRKGDVLAQLEMEEIDAEVRKAENALVKAKRDLRRARGLFEDSSATREQVQDLETALNIAQADLDIARFNQKHARIIASSDGVILKKFAEENEMVQPGNPVYRTGSREGEYFVLKVGLPDKDIVRLSLGDSAHVRFDPYPATQFNAKITEIAAASDPRNGSFEVELTLANPPKLLKNGFVGKVKIYPKKQESFYRLPIKSLVQIKNGNAVIYVPDRSGNTARQIEFPPGFIGDHFFTISTSDGEEITHVITDGSSFVSPGATIEIIEN